MRLKRSVILTFLICAIAGCKTQRTSISDSANVKVLIQLNGEGLILNKNYFINSSKSQISIKTCKFYLGCASTKGNFEESSYHLINIEEPESMTFTSGLRNITQAKFCLGVDSVTNSTGAKGKDLDPMKEMYWTWQSGYINVKLEGILNNKPFEYHLGGYSGELNSFQLLDLSINESKEILLNLNAFFPLIDENLKTQIMSPSRQAVNLSELLAQAFSTP